MSKPPPDQGGGWTFVPYITPTGRCEVVDFLDGLKAEKDIRKYAHFREVLKPEFEARGPFAVNGKYWKSLGDGFYEILFGRGRIYCSVLDPKKIVMYRAVIKLWRILRPKDRGFCEKCRTDLESVNYDQESREYLYRNYCKERSANGTS